MAFALVGRSRRTRKHAGSPLPDRGRSSAAAADFSPSFLALLVIFYHLRSGVTGLDVLDHTSSTKEIAAWAVETGRSPSGRRLRQEKEPLQPSASESSPSATKMEELAARGHSPTQYLLDANGGGEAVAKVTSAASRHGQPEPTADGQNPSHLQRRGKNFAHSSAPATRGPPAAKSKRKENAGGYVNATEEQASPLGSTRTTAKTNSTSVGDPSRLQGEPAAKRGTARESVVQQEQRRSRSAGTGGARGSRAASKSSGALTVTAATASSEYPFQAVENLIDGDLGSIAHTGDSGRTWGSGTKSEAQKCPWFQLDLGAAKTVDKVKLSADLHWPRMRRLLYVMPLKASGEPEFDDSATDMVVDDGTRGGVRVLVSDSPRDRADTSALTAFTEGNEDLELWMGTAAGSFCLAPPEGAECETIQCEDPANCLDRFAPESDPHAGVGTAVVDCKGKQGRYVVIELPGADASDAPAEIRALALREAAVEGGPAKPVQSSTYLYHCCAGVRTRSLRAGSGSDFPHPLRHRARRADSDRRVADVDSDRGAALSERISIFFRTLKPVPK
ncbi:unnamed protein product [Amoebophrya sp. A120]|nr:unnamed protein product [Amoebophrya sp. A120]|eukprot:GSA120T00015210001.1